MQINELPSLGRALQSGDQLAVDDANGVTYKVDAENINPTPSAISIPASRWSGSGSDYYITVTASNVTADSILIPQYDVSSAALLNGPVWCVPAAGSFTIHTSAVPSGTVTILVLFPGTMGEAHYEVLADVYSKSQVDSIVAQSTASAITQLYSAGNVTAGSTYPIPSDVQNCRMISVSFRRYGYCAAITAPYYALNNGASNGTIVWADNSTRYVTFKMSGNAITIIHDGMSSPIMEVMGIK